MSGAFTILAGLSLLIWIYLFFFRGGYWRNTERADLDLPAEPQDWPGLCAVIPARNEAAAIGCTIRSLLAQDYPVPFPIYLVDDGSQDATVEVACQAAADAPERLTVIPGTPVPQGWVGKVWAMSQGADRAVTDCPGARYLLFTDADIDHGPSSLRHLVARAEAGRLGLVSKMVKLSIEGLWERLLIPPFVYFFQMLYPFPWVNETQARATAAAGGCMLVRQSALQQAGGLQMVRRELIDDCALARAIAASGNTVWLGLTDETVSRRPYAGLTGVWNMVARSAYTQLDHSPIKLMLCVCAMVLVFLCPIIAVAGAGFFGYTGAVSGLGAYVLMSLSYLPMVRFYGQPSGVALTLPLAAALYTAMTVASAWRFWRGRGGQWKGRVYSISPTDAAGRP